MGVANVTVTLMLVMPIIPADMFGEKQHLNGTLEESLDFRSLPFDWSNQLFDITASPVLVLSAFKREEIE